MTKLREVMDAKGLTLAQISEATGLDTKTVWHATQARKVRRSTRKAISNYVGVPEEELFSAPSIPDCINPVAV